MKTATIELEEEIQALEPFPVPRAVNIDPGILNDCRIILASTKDHGHRIYRGEGIWEEVTLVYRRGAFQPLPWTYPDFRNPDYSVYFAHIRAHYLATLKELRPETSPPQGQKPPGPPPA